MLTNNTSSIYLNIVSVNTYFIFFIHFTLCINRLHMTTYVELARLKVRKVYDIYLNIQRSESNPVPLYSG